MRIFLNTIDLILIAVCIWSVIDYMLMPVTPKVIVCPAFIAGLKISQLLLTKFNKYKTHVD